MRKCLAVLLIAGLSFSMVACGGEDKAVTTKEVTTEATSAASEEATTAASAEATTAATEATTAASEETTTAASTEATTAAGAEATTAAEASGGSFAIATTASDDAVKAFATQVQNAIIGYDWATLGGYVKYPITIDGNQVANGDELKALLDDHIISPDFLSAVGQADAPNNMFANGQGICLADGNVWFLDENFDGISQNGNPSFKVIAINGIIGD